MSVYLYMNFEDSPFFNYLSTLSPIKPTKHTHAGRLFHEDGVPPTPQVFTSPRINPQRETNFLKRPQYLVSSDAELSLAYDDGVRMLTAIPEVTQPSASQSAVELIPRTEELLEEKDSVHEHPLSPSGCVDEFLADPLDECVNSTDLLDLHSSQATNPSSVLQSNFCNIKEASSELVDEGGRVQKDANNKRNIILTSSVQARENENANSPDHVEPPETEVGTKEFDGAKEKNNGRSHHGSQNLVSKKIYHPTESDLSSYPSLGNQNRQHFVDHDTPNCSSLLSIKDRGILECDKKMPNTSGHHHHRTLEVQLHPAESREVDEWRDTPALLPGSFLHDGADGVLNEETGAISCSALDCEMPYDCEEANQHQFGMRRRLQFESADDCQNPRESGSSWHQSNTLQNARSPSRQSHAELNIATSSKQAVTSQQAFPCLPFRPLKSLPTLINQSDSSARKDYSSPTTGPMPSGIGLHLNSIGRTIAVSSGMRKLPESDCENAKVEKPLSGSSLLPQNSKGWLVPVSVRKSSIKLSMKVDLLLTSVESTEVDQQEHQGLTVANSPTNFKTSLQNMKPSNSLQSTPDEQQLIPFENKMLSLEDASSHEEVNQMSPGKKRHVCALIFYCDCFAAGLYCAEPCSCQECFNKPEHQETVLGTRQQIESRNPLAFAPKIVRHVADSPLNNGAGVGCSAGCRCEGCANIFGKKDGFGEIMEAEHRKAEEDQLENNSNQKDKVDVKNDISLKDQTYAGLTNPTPLYRCSNIARDMPKARPPTRKRQLTSLESETSLSMSCRKSPRSPRNSSSLITAREGSTGLASYDHLDHHKLMETDPFSSRCDRYTGIFDISPLQRPQHSKATTASASDSGCPLKESRVQLCHGSSGLSTSACLQHDSPITPTARFRACKIVKHKDYDSETSNFSEDETPDILKDTCSPTKAVKTSSPNQKRVSPPHNCLRELRRMSSSPGLRSGRKFILQSVPSFPPLTPYSDPKGSEK
ncbi:hypothetical protein ACLOJK_031951 [Asimina triloba]